MIQITQDACDWIREKGYDHKMGARNIDRVMAEHIKKPLAEEILFGDLVKGGVVNIEVDKANNKLTFEISKYSKKRITSRKLLPSN